MPKKIHPNRQGMKGMKEGKAKRKREVSSTVVTASLVLCLITVILSKQHRNMRDTICSDC